MDPNCTAAEAVSRALRVAHEGSGAYGLGTGGYDPFVRGQGTVDEPWQDGTSDCSGFALSWCWKLRRHRPGFNVGTWATVSEDISCTSAIEDAEHEEELYTLADPRDVRAGDVLVYPTILIRKNGRLLRFVGHCGLVLDRNTYTSDTPGEWDRVMVAQCHGPNGFKPGVQVTTGAIWAHHDYVWPLPQHHTRVIRPKERS